jgi:hypothetical protein
MLAVGFMSAIASDCQGLSARSNAIQALMERASRWLIQRPGLVLGLFFPPWSWRFVLHESLQASRTYLSVARLKNKRVTILLLLLAGFYPSRVRGGPVKTMTSPNPSDYDDLINLKSG